jgi:hypothetical protein
VIPRDYITEWRSEAPWVRDYQALGSSNVDAKRIVVAFLQYMEHGGHTISRALFEKHMAEMMRDPEFLADISPLLSHGYEWNPHAEAPLVRSQLIELLPGEPWKGGAKPPIA